MEGSHPEHRQGRILELDGLRGLSVVLVIIYHFTRYAGQIPSPPWAVKVACFLGPFGVNIFLVISGYIITRLLHQEFLTNGSVSLRRFYLKRFFRIIPAYWFYILVVCLMGRGGCIVLAAQSVGLALIFVSNFPFYVGPLPGFWFLGHTWSLSLEEQYYLLFPPILWVMLRGKVRSITVVLLVFYALVAAELRISYEITARFPAVPIDHGFLLKFKYVIAGVLLALHPSIFQRAIQRGGVVAPLLLLLFLIAGGNRIPSLYPSSPFL